MTKQVMNDFRKTNQYTDLCNKRTEKTTYVTKGKKRNIKKHFTSHT